MAFIKSLIVAFLIDKAVTLDCYQCTSEDEWKCMDGELVENSLMPTNCSHIYGARYCIKSVGRYGGSYVKFQYTYLWSSVHECYSFRSLLCVLFLAVSRMYWGVL